MKKENARTIGQVCMVLSILCILFVCGNCCLNSQKGSYGPEEVYSRGDGTYGYGAKYYNSSTDQSMLVAVIGGSLFLVLIIASGIFTAMGDEDGKAGASKFMPSGAALSMKCPVCSKKCSIRAAACPNCGHPISRA